MSCELGDVLFNDREEDRIALSALFDHDPLRDENKLSNEKRARLPALRENLTKTGDAYAMHQCVCDTCKHRP